MISTTAASLIFPSAFRDIISWRNLFVFNIEQLVICIKEGEES